ncbi:MAG: flavin reductase family protein [Chloroflexota bacterium]
MKIDPESQSRQDSSHLLSDIVVPRPIAWISTVGTQGVFNLAPFSAYGMVSSIPMIVSIGISTNRNGQKKDTLKNIELTKEFVINIVTEELAETMNITCAPYPSDVSEFEKAGLTPKKADLVKAPMVAESPVNLECRLVQIIELGKMPAMTSLVIGSILRVHIRDEYYDKSNKRVTGLRTIARLGGESDLYCRSNDTFEMKRPSLE